MQNPMCRSLAAVTLAAMLTAGMIGCQEPTQRTSPVTNEQLRSRVAEVLRTEVAHEDPLVRCHALECLALMGGAEAKRIVQSHLYDPEPAVRFAAAMAAGDLRDHTARRPLYILLRDQNPSVKLAAGYACERLGDDRLGNWYDYVLVSDDATLIGQACVILGKLGNEGIRADSRTKLRELLGRPGLPTAARLEAAVALAQLGDTEVIERLLAFAGSTYADDRLMAVNGLEAIGCPDAFAMLTVMAGDPQIEVRMAAFRALGSANDAANIQEIRQALSYRDPDNDPTVTARVRGLALLALGHVGAPADSRHLYNAMDDPSPYIRLAAARGVISFLERQNAAEADTRRM